MVSFRVKIVVLFGVEMIFFYIFIELLDVGCIRKCVMLVEVVFCSWESKFFFEGGFGK